MFAIYKREVKSYFDTMMGWIFIAFMMVVTGIYMFVYNLYYGYPYFGYTLYGIEFLYMIFIPLLTMRSMAEERKVKTDQLLLTSPVSVTKIVMGKYLAMVTVLALALVPFLFAPVLISSYGNGSYLIDYSTMLAFFLLGCVYIGVGMLISSMTESQIIAAAGTFAILLLLHLWPSLMNLLPSSAGSTAIGIVVIVTIVCLILYYMTKNIVLALSIEAVGCVAAAIVYLVNADGMDGGLVSLLSQFNLSAALTNFGYNHIFDIGGLILYLSLIFLTVFTTVQMIYKRRWS